MKTIDQTTHVRVIDLTGHGILARDRVVQKAIDTQKDPRPGDRIVFMVDGKAKSDVIVPGEVEAAPTASREWKAAGYGVNAIVYFEANINDNPDDPVFVRVRCKEDGSFAVESVHTRGYQRHLAGEDADVGRTSDSDVREQLTEEPDDGSEPNRIVETFGDDFITPEPVVEAETFVDQGSADGDKTVAVQIERENGITTVTKVDVADADVVQEIDGYTETTAPGEAVKLEEIKGSDLL